MRARTVLVLILFTLSACASKPTPTPLPTLTPTSTANAAAPGPIYTIDLAKSIINYQASGALGIQLPGTFVLKGNSVSFVPEGDGYRIKVDAVIDGQSVTAVNGLVLSALRNSIEVDKFPLGYFTADSSEIIKVGGTFTFTASGTLQLHGQQQPVQMPLTVTLSQDQMTASGAMTVDLTDYGVNVPTAVMDQHVKFTAAIVATCSADCLSIIATAAVK